MNVETTYGLMDDESGQLLGVEFQPVVYEDHTAVGYTLDADGTALWSVETEEQARSAAVNSYSVEDSTYDRPHNPYTHRRLRVVAFEPEIMEE